MGGLLSRSNVKVTLCPTLRSANWWGHGIIQVVARDDFDKFNYCFLSWAYKIQVSVVQERLLQQGFSTILPWTGERKDKNTPLLRPDKTCPAQKSWQLLCLFGMWESSGAVTWCDVTASAAAYSSCLLPSCNLTAVWKTSPAAPALQLGCAVFLPPSHCTPFSNWPLWDVLKWWSLLKMPFLQVVWPLAANCWQQLAGSRPHLVSTLPCVLSASRLPSQHYVSLFLTFIAPCWFSSLCSTGAGLPRCPQLAVCEVGLRLSQSSLCLCCIPS